MKLFEITMNQIIFYLVEGYIIRLDKIKQKNKEIYKIKRIFSRQSSFTLSKKLLSKQNNGILQLL